MVVYFLAKPCVYQEKEKMKCEDIYFSFGEPGLQGVDVLYGVFVVYFDEWDLRDETVFFLPRVEERNREITHGKRYIWGVMGKISVGV